MAGRTARQARSSLRVPPAAGTRPALVLRGLRKSFGPVHAIDGLDLEVHRGEIFGLLGPNGSGKTTAIRLLCGLLKIDSGEADILGVRLPDQGIRTRVGYMPQDIALYPGLTVRETLEFFADLNTVPREEVRARLDSLLGFVALREKEGTLVAELSGGMRRRLSLACTMVHEPDLLFLDEPTVGVDPALRRVLWARFAELAGRGKTVIISTHYMDEARRCHRVGFLERGRILAVDRPDALLARTKTDSLEDAYAVLATEDQNDPGAAGAAASAAAARTKGGDEE